MAERESAMPDALGQRGVLIPNLPVANRRPDSFISLSFRFPSHKAGRLEKLVSKSLLLEMLWTYRKCKIK